MMMHSCFFTICLHLRIIVLYIVYIVFIVLIVFELNYLHINHVKLFSSIYKYAPYLAFSYESDIFMYALSLNNCVCILLI